ncbi:MAG TPA: ABC transporter ATP-binding protein [Candidatus Limnocylindrales bacterium]|nr:ABC transporter ATP-binding protein [Candidatus Limnocylindrales bacterium]
MNDQHPTAGAPVAPAVELRGIVKRFPGVLANDGVDFALAAGEVHALLGENGAGKSTLMNILDGLYQPDAGEILIDGRPVAFRSPRDAIAAGLGMVHQHFTLVASMTVTENILLGLDRPRLRLDLRRYDAEIGALAEAHGLDVDPRAKVWQLSVGERQRVEILKVLYRGARVLIMDEPTAVLAPQEVDDLFRTLRSMTAAGRSIVFISHKLGEVVAIADRVTVMRRGRVTASSLPAAGATKAQLATLMVGREVLESLERTPMPAGEPVLTLEAVEADNDKGLPALRGVSLVVRSGEIVGIAAVAGNGQSELAEVITGLRPCRGRVLVGTEDIANRPVRKVIARGVAHVPEDRTGVGTAPNLSLVDNLIMKRYRASPIGRGWTIDMGAARAAASQLKDDYQIAAPSVETQARLLSGGNIQRLILAREIESEPRLMIAVQPTRGLDVGAVESAHRLLLERRAAGAAILLISEDLDEILALADRVAVLYEGRVAGIADTADTDIASIGLLMTGGSGDEPAPEPSAVRAGGRQPG